MKVVYLTNLPSPYRVEFFNELVRGRIELTVIFEKTSVSHRDKNWKSSEKYLFDYIFAEKGLSGFSKLIKRIRVMDADLFVIHGYNSKLAMSVIEYLNLKRRPYIVSVDGGFVKKDNLIRKCIKRHFIGGAKAWLSTGKITDEYFVHYGADKNYIFEYPFTSVKESDILFPASIHEKEKYRRKIGISEKYIVLYVGQFIHRKGIDTILDVSDKTDSSEYGYYLVGGKDDDDLKQTIKDRGLVNVHIVPFKQKTELIDYYRASDVFLLPTREDIWGLVVNEAMGYGVPVISTNKCIAALTLIDEGVNGFITEVGDSDTICSCLQLLKDNPDLQEQMALACNRIAREYTIEKMAKMHIEIFNKLLSDSHFTR